MDFDSQWLKTRVVT